MINRLFNLFIKKLLSFQFLRDPGVRDANSNPNHRHRFTPEDDLDVCSYYLQTLSNVLRYSTEVAIASIAKDKVNPTDESAARRLKNCMCVSPLYIFRLLTGCRWTR